VRGMDARKVEAPRPRELFSNQALGLLGVAGGIYNAGGVTRLLDSSTVHAAFALTVYGHPVRRRHECARRCARHAVHGIHTGPLGDGWADPYGINALTCGTRWGGQGSNLRPTDYESVPHLARTCTDML
jgi:hypothetical protein